MAKMEIEELEDKSPNWKKRSNISYPETEDDKNAILELRAGTGGDEACIFVEGAASDVHHV